MSERARFRVIPAEHGMTLRVLLARRLPGRTQQSAAALVRAGGVYVNRLRVRIPGVRVAAGERITAYLGADRVAPVPVEALRIVHREPGFCVVDKPPGVPAEPPRETCLGSLAEALVRALAADGLPRPYVALVDSLPTQAGGLVLFSTRAALDRGVHATLRARPRPRTLRISCEHAGGPRLYEAVLDEGDPALLLERARAAGHPVVGDREPGSILHLCCAAMRFPHPTTGAPLSFAAELPAWAQGEPAPWRD